MRLAWLAATAALLVTELAGAETRVARDVVEVPGASRDAAIAERAAREYIAARWRSSGTLDLVSNRVDRGVRTVAFAQRVAGLEVVDAQAAVVIRNDRIFAATSSLSAEVDERAVKSSWPQPAVSSGSTPGDRLVIFDGHVARRYVAHDRVVYVGLDGASLGARSTIFDATGTLAFDVGIRQPRDARHAVPAANVSITVDAAATTTDADGAFSWTGTTAASVVPSVVGAYVAVTSASGPQATDTLTAQPSSTTTWSRATDELADAQLAAFIYTTEAKTKARAIGDASIDAWLDQPFPVTVNNASTEMCNASSSGDATTFSTAAGMCENTARIADVVHHEFGHALHKHGLIAGMGAYDQELSEGLADFFAATISNDRYIGRGLFVDDALLAMRDLDRANHEYTWPLDRGGDPHKVGLIIASTLWDLRSFGGAALAETIFWGVLQRAPSIDAAYLAAQITDDDNANLADGTPHQCEIGKAFALHGLAPPDFGTTTVGAPLFEGDQIKILVSEPVNVACPAPTTIGGEILDRSGAHISTLEKIPVLDVSGTLLAAAVPEGEFFVRIALSDGRVVELPDNPADPYYQHYTNGEAIACNPATTPSDDAWQSGRPDAPSPDPQDAHSDHTAIGTTIHGNGHYAPGTSTRLTASVAIPRDRYREIHLRYFRWLSVEDSRYDRATIEAGGQTIWTNATDRLGTLDHIDREWRMHDLDVTSHVAIDEVAGNDNKLDLAWTLDADTIGELGGWTLDDICVVGIDRLGCGNGTIDADEECDDGNDIDADGCTSCVSDLEPAPPPGCCDVGSDPTGAVMIGFFMLLLRIVRSRKTIDGSRVDH